MQTSITLFFQPPTSFPKKKTFRFPERLISIKDFFSLTGYYLQASLYFTQYDGPVTAPVQLQPHFERSGVTSPPTPPVISRRSFRSNFLAFLKIFCDMMI
jgi:hypothetical protein